MAIDVIREDFLVLRLSCPLRKERWGKKVLFQPVNEKFPWESSSYGNFLIKINKAMSFDFGLGPQLIHSHYCHEWCAQSL